MKKVLVIVSVAIMFLLPIVIQSCKNNQSGYKLGTVKSKVPTKKQNIKIATVQLVKSQFLGAKVYGGARDNQYIVVQGDKVYLVIAGICGCFDNKIEIDEIQPLGEY